MRLRQLATPGKAEILQRFFKTGPGEYGAGDVFLGVMVPDIRRGAREFADLPEGQVSRLLASRVHEERLTALLILVRRFEKGDERVRRRVYAFYLRHLSRVNNWDLVDLTAPNIVGAHLLDRDRRVLDRLARSPDLWRRRVAIVATHAFIRRGEFADTLRLSERLLGDPEDLIHKAAGWMLREVGKRDPASLERFLRRHCRGMPRTMLRYAIERLPETRRRAYLAGVSSAKRLLSRDPSMRR
jgi:3-methyladenine DNA glycosylase AlkD